MAYNINYIKPPCLHSYIPALYITRRHYNLPCHRMMPAQLYHNVLVGTMMSHYTAQLRLTISPHDAGSARLQHNVLSGTITSQ